MEDLSTQRGKSSGAVQGLHEAFESAGLGHLISVAENWCTQEGAAFLHEVVDEFDALTAFLGIDAHAKQRLSRVLKCLQDDDGACDCDMPQQYPPSLTVQQKQPQFRLLAFGDSLTAGFYNHGEQFEPYGKSLVDALAPHLLVEVWVNGLSGFSAERLASTIDSSRIRDVTRRTGRGLRVALDLRGPFDLVLIMAGTNDLGTVQGQAADIDVDAKAQSIFEDVKQLHLVCHEREVRTVVLSVPEGFFVKDAPVAQCLRRLNCLLMEWATCCDNVAFFVDASDFVPWLAGNECWDPDGIHFSPVGSQQLGNGIAEAFLKYANVSI